MFVAYLIPKHDHHLLVEDGLGYLAKGETEAQARQALLDQVRNTGSVPLSDAELAELLEDNCLFVNEV